MGAWCAPSRGGRCWCWRVTALLALGGAALALRLEPSAATDTLVDPGSESYAATERFKHDFGDEAVLVLVQGELARTVLTQDLGRVLAAGGLPVGQRAPKKGLRQSSRPCAASSPSSSRPRRCTGRRRSSTPRSTRSRRVRRRQKAPPSARPQRRPRRRARLSRRRGDPPAEQERLARAAAQAVQRAVHPAGPPARAALRHHRPPAHRRPELRLGAGFDSRAPASACPSRASPTCSRRRTPR